MEVETPREFFEKVLPSKFDPKKTAGLEAVIQMNITGPKGGHWVITIRDQKMNITDGIHQSPSMAIEMTDNDFVDIINGKLAPIQALMTGKLEFKGSLSLGMKLMSIGFM